ncbi:hypothetical protein [Leeuwenhoekiella marinoflava]|uniref:Uncharacterized protein n=2 Tax=Leeuwenhoekiella marinoflava TaxID=988 RepID=A0A4Q0PR28_9FLAO|nr:hypothetical protein [Leeuwenhoekiella marinoflava]RXG33013.1 hypothetical protein DSL99_106 [Leeuwenhoekiella marinoflava]SHE35445.1 hypothetical protein SAMN02745246_00165 [Leeuwenhoekiella marinoflava DSM 3653]
MHLHYSGKQSFTNKAVNKANRILVSSFYQKEIENKIDFIDTATLIAQLKSNNPETIEVVSSWGPFKLKKEDSILQTTKISINRSHIKNSRYLLVVKLLTDYTCIQLGLLDTAQEEKRRQVGLIIEKLVKSYI